MMWSEFVGFAQLGFQHIVSTDAADHVLFLLVLAAIYRVRDWRAVLWVVSAFTIGHSITLALAVMNVLVLPSPIVEFLIPVTIVATAVENLVQRQRAAAGKFSRNRVVFAALFGLVHGAGFAGYLRSLFLESIAMPLVGFNLGIEVGQIVVLLLTAVVFRGVDAALTALAPQRESFSLRLVGVSCAVMVVASSWAWERLPR
jgi:HupE / UreJ protein